MDDSLLVIVKLENVSEKRTQFCWFLFVLFPLCKRVRGTREGFGIGLSACYELSAFEC